MFLLIFFGRLAPQLEEEQAREDGDSGDTALAVGKGDAPQFDDITMLCLECKARMEANGYERAYD